MNSYKSKADFFTTELSKINTKYNTVSLLRLLSIILFIVLLYYYFQNSAIALLFLAGLFFASFIILMRIHSKLQFKRKINQALLAINTDEISFLERKTIPFENGEEFQDFQHPYAYDLDIFGNHSLFQHLNRSATFIGKKILATTLLHKSGNDEILSNQEAIAELSQKLDWRQEFLAFAKVTNDSESSYKTLLQWSTFNSESLPKWLVFFSYASPLFFVVIFISYLLTSNLFLLSCLSYLFVLNLMVLGRFFKRIQL